MYREPHLHIIIQNSLRKKKQITSSILSSGVIQSFYISNSQSILQIIRVKQMRTNSRITELFKLQNNQMIFYKLNQTLENTSSHTFRAVATILFPLENISNSSPLYYFFLILRNVCKIVRICILKQIKYILTDNKLCL